MMTNREPDAVAPLKQDERHDNGLRHEQDERPREEVNEHHEQRGRVRATNPARARNPVRRNEIECAQVAGRDEPTTTYQRDSGQQP